MKVLGIISDVFCKKKKKKFKLESNEWFSTTDRFSTAKNTCQCLETSLIVTSGGGAHATAVGRGQRCYLTIKSPQDRPPPESSGLKCQ